jgi:Leucine-rich repeat (LRR) protein
MEQIATPITPELAQLKAKSMIAWRAAGYPDAADKKGPWLEHLSLDDYNPQSFDTLDLAGLGLTQLPAELAQLQGVEYLMLQANQLSSIDTTLLKNLRLKSLSLTNNPLVAIDAALFEIDTLVDLYLDSTALAALPTPRSKVTQLEMLNLSDNPKLALPEGFFAQFPNLKSLILDGYSHASFPAGITQLSQLKQLSLDKSGISALPAGIAALAQLRQLSIEHAKLRTLPKALASMQGLNELARKLNFMGIKLAGNPFTDQELRKIAKLKNPDRTERVLAWAGEHGSP